MKTRGIHRREALKRLGASTVALAAFHPWVPRQSGELEWSPRYLSPAEVETLTELSERILPETETAGARRANVHQYIDWILSQERASDGEAFRAGLRRLNEDGVARFGRSFVELSPDERDALLTRLSASGDGFFEEAKRLTVEGYYRSEAGMTEELGFEGNSHLAEFEGCAHEAHHGFKPGP